MIYPVTDSEFEATRIGEADYLPTRIEPSAITWLDDKKATPGPASSGTSPARLGSRPPTEHPIVQSYVDICIDGCIQIEEMYPLAQDAHFAEVFVKDLHRLEDALDQRSDFPVSTIHLHAEGLEDRCALAESAG